MTSYLLEHAVLPTGVADSVLVEIQDGRFTKVLPDSPGGTDAQLLGLSIPAFANAHSHAFHRVLRGRTQAELGSFWTWRSQMYDVAATLTPERYYDLARRTYSEMVGAGIGTVGEFHYLHHQPDGSAYDDPNAMGLALIAAARDTGLRITLLDTCYLSAGFGRPVEGPQIRYSDGDAATWARRFERLVEHHDPIHGVVVGAAIHSVRAVPREELPIVVEMARGRPLHFHLSEQPRENAECLAAYDRTPAQILAEAGALGPDSSAVHATHLTDGDIALLGGSETYACFCPTTERDLADGIGPSARLVQAGSPLTLGSDSHAVIDMFEEMKAVEMHERLASNERGHWRAIDLLSAGTSSGHRSLGFADAGAIEVGARADLVTIALDTPRTWGTGPSAESAVFAATSADVGAVLIDGVRR